LVRLRKLKCKIFPIRKTYNFSKTQNFHNSLKFRDIILETKENFTMNYKKHFYLPHMEYEGSIGFVMRKMKIFIAYFHV
jgi:hypothetical protein